MNEFSAFFLKQKEEKKEEFLEILSRFKESYKLFIILNSKGRNFLFFNSKARNFLFFNSKGRNFLFLKICFLNHIIFLLPNLNIAKFYKKKFHKREILPENEKIE